MKNPAVKAIILLLVFVLPIAGWVFYKLSKEAGQLRVENARLTAQLQEQTEVFERALVFDRLLTTRGIEVPLLGEERTFVLKAYDRLMTLPPTAHYDRVCTGVYFTGHFRDEPDETRTICAQKKPSEPLDRLDDPESYIFKLEYEE